MCARVARARWKRDVRVLSVRCVRGAYAKPGLGARRLLVAAQHGGKFVAAATARFDDRVADFPPLRARLAAVPIPNLGTTVYVSSIRFGLCGELQR